MQHSFSPAIYHAEEEYSDEYKHLIEDSGYSFKENHCPGEKEYGFHIEYEEQYCENIVANLDLRPAIWRGFDAAFVGDVLHGGGPPGSDYSGCHKHAQYG